MTEGDRAFVGSAILSTALCGIAFLALGGRARDLEARIEALEAVQGRVLTELNDEGMLWDDPPAPRLDLPRGRVR